MFVGVVLTTTDRWLREEVTVVLYRFYIHDVVLTALPLNLPSPQWNPSIPSFSLSSFFVSVGTSSSSYPNPRHLGGNHSNVALPTSHGLGHIDLSDAEQHQGLTTSIVNFVSPLDHPNAYRNLSCTACSKENSGETTVAMIEDLCQAVS